MESLEKTPTPREMLFSLQQHLSKLTADKNEFYSELSKRVGEEEIAVADSDNLASATEVYNEDYTQTTRDEDGEVTEQVNLLLVLQSQFAELQIKITQALENKVNFGALLNYLELEQRQIYDDVLFRALKKNDEAEVEGDLDVLTDWYNDILTKTILYLDRIYQEPQFDLEK